MVGVHTGLKARLRTFTSNPPLTHTHCYAHKLELCINKAFNEIIDKEKYIDLKKNITTAINGLSDFYGSRAVKRKAELVEQCAVMNIKMYKLKRIFGVRWCASQVVAINSVHQMYACTWTDLVRIIDDETPENALRRNSAMEHLETMQNANYFVALAFFQDIFQVVQKYSLAYQKQAAVLPGQKVMHERLKTELEALAEDDGPVLRAAIRRITCTKDFGRIQPSHTCKQYIYDSSVRAADNVILLLDHKKIPKPKPVVDENAEQASNDDGNNNNNGNNNNDDNNNNNNEEEEEQEFMAIDEIVLDDEDVVMDSGSEDEGDDETSDFYRFQFAQFDQSNPKTWPSLITYRKKFVKALIQSLQDYYDNDDINDFEVLNVNGLQVTNGEIIFPENNQEQHDNLARRFKINSPNIGLQYQNLLKNVLTTVTATEFQKWMLEPPQIFYAKLIETAESDGIIDLSDELFDYISSALTVPVGSADAERGFSILFHSLDSRRSRLNISTIDSILNIRLNGPPLTKFVCYKYVEDWKNEKHLDSNAQRPRGQGKKKMNNIILSDDPVENFVKDEEVQNRWERRFELFIPDPFN